MLANASIRVGRPGDAVPGDLTIGSDGLTFEHHAPAAKAAFEQKQRSRSVDPGLMPDLASGVVHVQALAAVATAGGVTLMQHATGVLARDAVHSRELSIGGADVPLAEPEVELTVLASVACACGSRRRREEGGQDGNGKRNDGGMRHSAFSSWSPSLSSGSEGGPGARH